MRRAGWLVLSSLLAWGVYDIYALPKGHESFSGAVARYIYHDQSYIRWSARLFSFILLKHLMVPKLLPKTDPFHHLSHKMRRVV